MLDILRHPFFSGGHLRVFYCVLLIFKNNLLNPVALANEIAMGKNIFVFSIGDTIIITNIVRMFFNGEVRL